jgi:hypothetical protein
VKVRLKGKSRRGKNRVREHGDFWTVEQTSESVMCLDGDPGLLLSVQNCECPTCEKWGPDRRWIRRTNDLDFEILERETIDS